MTECLSFIQVFIFAMTRGRWVMATMAHLSLLSGK